ncbi:hypothetical protein ELO61_19745, partial [Klebsiella pneumoniae]|nr:hypothetical protein [Klebsiella pneumoniae]
KSAQIREILISESAWEEMTCLFAPSLSNSPYSSSPVWLQNTRFCKIVHVTNPLELIIHGYCPGICPPNS